MRSRWADERGSATAELAVALPAVALVLALCLGAVQVVATQVRLTDAAADAARALGRGEAPGTAIAIAGRVAGVPVALSTVDEPPLVCVTLRSAASGVLGLLGLRAESCAVGGGG
ncbi:TadE family type IV pilus minor pilin [Agromyces sp. LHK192]|uniref:TadE family type IV pilus minor pilin n=1 Tax=Agromyces sp. LHK192 TaxID=2498704 RepID=UPI000FDAF056|nr:TadE family type IV pilus minor pilin [Agromyces sp. LHK192]